MRKIDIFRAYWPLLSETDKEYARGVGLTFEELGALAEYESLLISSLD